MESLQLFPVEKSPRWWPPESREVALEELDDSVLHETELFLADHLEREGDVAVAQVALRIREALGVQSDALLEAVAIDSARFPRTCSALARVVDLLRRPVSQRPEGFWPRFLLEQLEACTR